MDDIFAGQVVLEVSIPKVTFFSPHERREWAMLELGAYVARIHGKMYLSAAEDNMNKSGRLTGIQITVQLMGDNSVTYAIIEPRNNPESVLFISKIETAGSGASISDIIDHEIAQKEQCLESPLARALRLAGADLGALPESSEFVVLEVNIHPKTKRPALKPIVMKSDPVLNNRRSLRIFHGNPPRGSLKPGQNWRARVVSFHPISPKKECGVPIVHVNVLLLDQIV